MAEYRVIIICELLVFYLTLKNMTELMIATGDLCAADGKSSLRMRCSGHPPHVDIGHNYRTTLNRVGK